MTADLSKVRLLVMDVDGTLTNGSLYFDDAGREYKQFHIQDGLGIVLAGLAGLQIAWITGRQSPIVERRARELNVPFLMQGVRDKGTALMELAANVAVAPAEVAFIGDDLNDLLAMRWVGVALAPANAVPEVRAVAHFVMPRDGGAGAVRDAVEAILRARNEYDTALGNYLISLAVPLKTPVS